MKKILSALVCTTIFFAACDKNDADDLNMNETDRNFMVMASHGNHNEITAGHIADSNGMNISVRDFGSMMVMDHGTAQNELSNIAAGLGVTIPQMPDSAHIAMGQMLRSLSGIMFDSTYMDMQIVDHAATIQLFQNEINNGINEDVKDYAEKYLPKIQMHYQMADSIRMEL